ncbi:cytosolic phospholipase A2-like isoform X2 [Mya arenaria]|uniref:cytosolic phospholipase A2-like isoform X2 n=1 Tax=Mya arenaria TaxID=6604 RepID=UPI0022E2967F|nr:cytosolic phospholipase A2-like isoform X2 [Mya arenaria]
MVSVDKRFGFSFSNFDPTDVRRYVPAFNVANYRHRIRRFLSSPSAFLSNDEHALDDEAFFTPTAEMPVDKEIERKKFDPYQIFEVDHRPCLIFTVKVLCGRNITLGWKDYVDTPDPYVRLFIETAPEGRRKTTVKDNDTKPQWDETFEFLLNENEINIMEIRLMEDNYPYMNDDIVGIDTFDIGSLTRDKWTKKTFVFNQVSEVDIEMKVSLDTNPTLRYSLCLCEQEKEYLTRRKVKVMEAMTSLLGEQGPHELDEVPTIGVIGSGGGFRAMVGLSGVVKALHDSGILQCATYLGGLSGSSWYISTLYSHQNWPQMAPGDMQDELKNNIDSSLLWLLKPQSVYRYMDMIMKKRQNGQPVSFTDFFGHMVGETLLGGRLQSRLSDQKAKLEGGNIPLPLLTCVHVKKDRSARDFQEWVEFSPYEIGMAKYGTFMPTDLFGCKFFMGRLAKTYEEPPLHFLQGIWGSAFCILFKRLLDDNKKLDPVEMIRLEMAKQLEENEGDESSDSSDEGEFDDGEPSTVPDAKYKQKSATLPSVLSETRNRLNYTSDQRTKRPSVDEGQGREMPRRMVSTRRTKQKGYWSNFLKGVFENKRWELLSTRAGRAGVVHNFMRGLSLQQSYPLSPFSPVSKEAPDENDEVDGPGRGSRVSDDFNGIFEMHPTSEKHLYMVDAGLTFNSPYPVVLRPQREVDIILSFDFSARPGDNSPPFKELLLAAKWAKKHKVMFPPIDSELVTKVFDREGLKELYIFRHPTEPACPIVLHFVLVNIEFRKFIKPGLRRKTQPDKDFADFDIFDDPATPYSTFNFKYPHLAFERLSKLTEFNTMLNIEEIKKVMVEVIEKKRAEPDRCPCKLEEVPRLRRVSQKNQKRLSTFLSRIRSGRFSRRDAGKSIDKPLGDAIQEEKNGSIDVVDAAEGPLSREVAPKLTSDNVMQKQDSKAQAAVPEYEGRLRRKAAISKKMTTGSKSLPAVNSDQRQGFASNGNVVSLDSSQVNKGDAQIRDVPGRRKPQQPEKARLWHDSKCNSIDDDDDRFFTAVE